MSRDFDPVIWRDISTINDFVRHIKRMINVQTGEIVVEKTPNPDVESDPMDVPKGTT